MSENRTSEIRSSQGLGVLNLSIQKKGCLWKVSYNNSNVRLLLSAMGARPMTASDCRDGGSGGAPAAPAYAPRARAA